MNIISREELKDRIGKNGKLAVVEVLASDQYEQGHIPGAMNVPLGDQFDEIIQQALPDKDKEVVVYCGSKDCDASPRAAARMEELGYEHVYDYQEGKAGWKEADLPLVT